MTADAIYIATYSKTVNKYTIRFVNADENNTELSSAEYDYGTAAADITKPSDPTKAADAQYTYTFTGWTPDIAEVTGNATYTATYSTTVNKYTVTFVDENGTTVLKEATEYDYGTAANDIAKPDDPTKEATVDHVYTFAGWTPAIATVTENATYTASYTESVRK